MRVDIEDLTPIQVTCLYGARAHIDEARNAAISAAEPIPFVRGKYSIIDRIDLYAMIAEHWATATTLLEAAGIDSPATDIESLWQWLNVVLRIVEDDEEERHNGTSSQSST